MNTLHMLRTDLVLPKKLKNRFFARRHGRALSNVERILVSDLTEGAIGWGLVEEGKAQAREFDPTPLGLNEDTIVISSPFKRAVETAEITAQILGVGKIYSDLRLRERWFGDLDGQKVNLTQQVWAYDLVDPNHHCRGMESPNQVGRRLTHLIKNLEENFSGKDIMLVSHGDPLSILMALFKRVCLSQHSQLVRFKNAETKALELAPI